MAQSSVVSKLFGRSKDGAMPQALRPMPFWLSLLMFGIPALLMVASIYLFAPWLQSLGISEVKSFFAAHIVPTALLFGAALVALYRVDGYPITWRALGARFRFPRLRVKDGLWALAIFVGLMLGYGVFSQIGMALIVNGLIPIPAGIPALMDPRAPLTAQLAGGLIRGNWEIVALWFVMLFFNIAGEELWWRGYILPRQELAHGRWTWVLHGLLWTAFHAFKWWDIIGLLPVCLIIAFTAQRLKNNWPVFIAHYVFNGLAFPVVVMAVLGIL